MFQLHVISMQIYMNNLSHVTNYKHDNRYCSVAMSMT